MHLDTSYLLLAHLGCQRHHAVDDADLDGFVVGKPGPMPAREAIWSHNLSKLRDQGLALGQMKLKFALSRGCPLVGRLVIIC